jgi:hypothetical protein
VAEHLGDTVAVLANAGLMLVFAVLIWVLAPKLQELE